MIESCPPCVLWLCPDPEDCDKALPRDAACTLEEYLWGTPHRQVIKHIDSQTPAIHEGIRDQHTQYCVTCESLFLSFFYFCGGSLCSCPYWLWCFCSVLPSSCVFHFLHFSPCLLSHSHSLPLLLSLHSSPSYTNWLCSRAPSPSHQATRDSLVCSATRPAGFQRNPLSQSVWHKLQII